MKIEELPFWRDCDLQADMLDPPMPLNPIQQFVFKYSPEQYADLPAIDAPFRTLLTNAITFAEDAQSAKLLNKLIARAEEFKAAGLTGAFITTLGLIRDCEAIINPGSNMKNGHLCGALCEVCKHADDEEGE